MVIDAGSSHTSLYVYAWNVSTNGTGLVQQVYSTSATGESGDRKREVLNKHISRHPWRPKNEIPVRIRYNNSMPLQGEVCALRGGKGSGEGVVWMGWGNPPH